MFTSFRVDSENCGGVETIKVEQNHKSIYTEHVSSQRGLYAPTQEALVKHITKDVDTLLQGRWVLEEYMSAPYTLNESFLPNWSKSRWFWHCPEQPKAGKLSWVPQQIDINLTSLQLRSKFCSMIPGKIILFVGDSITGQMFSSFVHLLGIGGDVQQLGNFSSLQAHEIGLTTTTCANFLDGDFVNVSFIRNEYLSLDGRTLGSEEPLEYAGKWLLDWLPAANQSDVLVLNSGRHVRSDEYQESIKATLSWLESNAGGKDIFFISTKIETGVIPPDLPLPGDVSLQCVAPLSMQYENGIIAEQNQFVKNTIMNNAPMVEFLDFSCLDLLNSYGYKDPAHSCMPGPVDYKTLLFIAKFLGKKRSDQKQIGI